MMSCCWPTRLPWRGGEAFQPSHYRQQKRKSHLCPCRRLSTVLDKDYPGSVFSVLKMSVLWNCLLCHLEGLSLPAEYQSPCCSITGLEAPPPPPSPTPLPSACLLHSPVETTLILGNVSCWFIFYVILFLFGRIYIYIYIYKYIDIYHYRIMHW